MNLSKNSDRCVTMEKQVIVEVCTVLLFVAMAVAEPAPEIEALMGLKGGLHDPFGMLKDWVPSMTGNGQWCSWRCVMCSNGSAGSKITGLDLSKMNLSGTITDSILQLAPFLTHLNISNNLFAGKLPVSLTNLTNLISLDISHNAFNGPICPGFNRLTALVKFTAYSNSFAGPLPREFAELPLLQHLDFGGSYFTGAIPSEYGALGSLQYLDLSGNNLNGSIPTQLGNLTSLRLLKIGWNKYNGGVPPALGNLSALECLDLAGASLTGAIPRELGLLSRLRALILYQNMLSGSIPAELGNVSTLLSVDLSENMLTGELPTSLANLHNLTRLSLMYNKLTGKVLPAMASLPNLEILLVWNNSFTGHLPQDLGVISPLRWFDASANRLTGPIPQNLCARGQLFKLMLFSNDFFGAIPRSLASCEALWRLRLEDNRLSGSIPAGFGILKNITYFDVSHNHITGPLPHDLMEAPVLQFMDISENPISSPLPAGFWSMRSLQKFYAAAANINGDVSDVQECPPLIALDLSSNHLSGSLSAGLGLCEKLILLNVSCNELAGPIPEVLASLPVLATLDLSKNFFNGSIPSNFENATALEVLDMSYNDLTGIVPLGGLFKFMNPSMLAGNKNLCGGVLGACGVASNQKLSASLPSPLFSKKILAWVAGSIFAMAVIVFLGTSSCFYKQYRWYVCSKLRHEGAWKLTTFQRLSFTADDILRCLTTDNIIGMGAAGTVYRADLPSGEVVAVKKLWKNQKDALDVKEHHILGEVDVLGNVRHRNIVRLLGCCTTDDTTLLLYEYMPNGSLADLLHGDKEANVLADWMTRYKIAVGVAQGLCYLHHDCFPVVVHRDVKSNNILLDSNMESRVADFGVAKLLETTETMSVVAGSYGYIAPEYAYTMQVDEKSDIYSFGVVLLELLTGKRPVEPEFGEAANIVEWVREKVDEASDQREVEATVLDGSMGGASLKWVHEEMMLVLRVALLCTSKNPIERPSMRDVVTMLSEAKPRRKPTSTAPTR